MPRKKKRCLVAGCGTVIKPEFRVCYRHRKMTPTEMVMPQTPAVKMRRFYCDECGTSCHDTVELKRCSLCGNTLMETTGL